MQEKSSICGRGWASRTRRILRHNSVNYALESPSFDGRSVTHALNYTPELSLEYLEHATFYQRGR